MCESVRHCKLSCKDHDPLASTPGSLAYSTGGRFGGSVTFAPTPMPWRSNQP